MESLSFLLTESHLIASDQVPGSSSLGFYLFGWDFCLSVLANEGDAYPVGALPVGTLINNLESHPGKGAQYIRAAGQYWD